MAIVRRYLRDPTFSRFDTIPECDRHTHTHTTTAYTALSKASRGKNVVFQSDGQSEQEALLWQRDRETRLSLEILQLQNIFIV